METSNKQKHLLVNKKKEMKGWLIASLKCTETRDELLTDLQSKIKVMSRYLSVPDATSLHYCLKYKQLKLYGFSGKDPSI